MIVLDVALSVHSTRVMRHDLMGGERGAASAASVLETSSEEKDVATAKYVASFLADSYLLLLLQNLHDKRKYWLE